MKKSIEGITTLGLSPRRHSTPPYQHVKMPCALIEYIQDLSSAPQNHFLKQLETGGVAYAACDRTLVTTSPTAAFTAAHFGKRSAKGMNRLGERWLIPSKLNRLSTLLSADQ